MKNQILLALSFFCTTGILNAQNVQVKQDKIYIDGKEVFSYYKSAVITPDYYICKLNTRDTLITMLHHDNGTEDFRTDDYVKINFLTLKKSLTTAKVTTAEKLVKLLLENGALDLSGTLKPDKVDVFIRKYNQNITEKK